MDPYLAKKGDFPRISVGSKGLNELAKERRGSPVVRTLAYHAAGPSSIPGLGGENY